MFGQSLTYLNWILTYILCTGYSWFASTWWGNHWLKKNNCQNFAWCQQRVTCYRCSDSGDCARSLHRPYLDKKRLLPREIYLLLLHRLDGSRRTARELGSMHVTSINFTVGSESSLLSPSLSFSIFSPALWLRAALHFLNALNRLSRGWSQSNQQSIKDLWRI